MSLPSTTSENKSRASKTKKELLEELERIERFVEERLGAAEGHLSLENASLVSDAKLREFSEIASCWFFETDADLRFTYISRSDGSSAGDPPEPFGGNSLRQILADAQPAAAAGNGSPSDFMRILDSRRPFRDLIFSSAATNGSPSTNSINGNPIVNGNGEFHGYRGAITQLPAAYAGTGSDSARHEQLLAAFGAMPYAVALFDADDRLLASNDSYPLLPELPAETLARGVPFEDLLRGNVRSGMFVDAIGREEQFIQERLRAHRNPGEPRAFRLKGGRWLQIHEKRTPDGGTIGLYSDVTDQKIAEEAHEIGETRYRTAVDAGSVGVWEWNLETGELHLAPNLKALLGYGEEEIVDRMDDWMRIVHPDNRAELEQALEKYLSGENPQFELEHRALHQDGGIHWFLCRGTALRDAAGKPLRMWGTETDITGIKRNESTLRESEERYRNLVENSIQGILIHRHDKPLFVNKAFCRIHGYDSIEEIMALDSVAQLHAPAERERLAAYTELRLNDGTAPEFYTLQALRKDGSFVWRENFVSTVSWQGEPAVQVATHDISERISAQLAVRESEENYRTLVEGSIQGIMVDCNLKPVFANMAFARIHGYDSPAEILALKSSRELYSAHGWERISEYYDARAAGKPAPERYEVEGLRKDGTPVWRENIVTNFTWEGRYAVLVTTQDITERVRAEEALHYNQRLMEAVLDTMPSAVWVKDREGRYLIVNKAMADGYGRTPQDFMGRTSPEVGHLDKQVEKWFRETDAQVMKTGERLELPERRLQMRDGRQMVRHILKLPLRNEAGDIVGVLSVSDDITERKRAEEELRQSQQRLSGILDIADDAIISTDERQTITMYNKGAERIFGFSAEEAIGRPLDLLLPDYVRRAHGKYMKDFSNADHAVRAMSERTEVHGLRKNGEVFPADASISKLEIDGRKIFTVMLRDITQRKLAEEALRDSRRLLETVFNTIPHAIAVKDTESRYVMVNDAACGLLGAPADQILDKTVDGLEHRPEADIRSVMEEDAKLFRTGETVVSQGARLHGDGRELEIMAIRSPLRDDEGKVVGLVVVNVDITERVQAERSAQEAHMRLVDAVESISLGFVLFDPEDRLVLWNEKFAEINSHIRELLVPGATFESLIDNPARRARVSASGRDPEEWIRRRMEYHKNPQGSTERRGDDGEWYLTTERRTQEGGVTGVWTDITERKSMEEALRAREEQLQLFITHAPVAVAMFDRDMRYLVHSRRWVEDFNLGSDDLIGRSQYEVFPETPQHWIEAYKRCLAGAVETRDEDSFYRADGSLCWVRWEIHPWRNMRGEINGIVTFIEVINERKKAEAQLIRSQRMEAIGQLTGGVAHEFNNLLHIIQSYAFLLGEDAADSPRQLSLIDPIKNASKRGSELVKRLLSFSRRQILQPKLTDLTKVTLDLIELMRTPLGETIELVTVTSENLWPILVDQGELENALLNLALNARDAMPQGGKLTITTENFSAPAGTEGGNDTGDTRKYVKLAVTDTGEGMTPEVRDRVFEPFFTTKDMAEHSGLGLSMVDGFVSQSGGYVAIETEVGQGSTITLYLPCAEN